MSKFCIAITFFALAVCNPVAGQSLKTDASNWQTCEFDFNNFEPFGAEDRGQEDNVPSIPEPMVFDLVRGLGADKGEFEVNVLSLFPLNDTSEVKAAWGVTITRESL